MKLNALSKILADNNYGPGAAEHINFAVGFCLGFARGYLPIDYILMVREDTSKEQCPSINNKIVKETFVCPEDSEMYMAAMLMKLCASLHPAGNWCSQDRKSVV